MKLVAIYLILLLLLTLLLNQSISISQSKILSNDSKVWEYVVSFDGVTSKKCSDLCDFNSDCSMWLVDSNLNNKCYIISNELSQKIVSLYKEQLISNKEIQFGFSKSNIKIDRLIGDSLPFASSSLYNQRQHFSYDCKYTISLWAWIWKGHLKNANKDSNTFDKVIFSTRPISDLYQEEAYLPAILFNLKVDQQLLQEDSLFFSVSKDENGDYVGFRPPGAYVRYHQWMHIILSIDGGILSAFIDGKLMGQVDSFGDNKPKYSACPYLEQHMKYKNKYEHFNFSSEIKSNTILQMFGHRSMHDVTTSGMIQDFVVIRNFAVKDSRTATAIMNQRIPETPYQLTLMLRSLDIYTLDGFSPQPWELNPYLMKEWNLCPQSLCGIICLDPKFLLGIHAYDDSSKFDTQVSANNNTNSFKLSVNLTDYNGLINLFPATIKNELQLVNYVHSCGFSCFVESKNATAMISRDLLHAGIYWYLGNSNIVNSVYLKNCDDLSCASELKFASAELKSRLGNLRNVSNFPRNWPAKRLNVQKAWASFALALWINDETYESYADMKIPWSFPYPNIAGQPMHLALAFIYGVENRDLNYALKPIINYHHNQYTYSELMSNDGFKCYIGLINAIDKIADFIDSFEDISPESYNLSCESLDPTTFAPTLFDFITYVENGNTSFLYGESRKIHFLDMNLNKSRKVNKITYYDRIPPWYEMKMQIDEIKAIFSSFKEISSPNDQFRYSNLNYQNDLMIDDLSCMASASLLFPVTQYVASHYGVSNEGILIPQNVLLSNGDLDTNSHLKNSDLLIHWSTDANAGDVEALLFMGRRFFWGLSGEDINHEIARKWFEAAAKKDDPEGLYNIGIMCLHGQGGLTVNITLAHWYLNRSAFGASQGKPFASAYHALGNLYITPENTDYYNETKAREMFKRAAQLDCSYGHFSYAMMLRDENNIAGTLYHLARAGTLGNLRAVNYLAHALYDHESWYYHTSAVNNKSTIESKYNLSAFPLLIGETYIEIPWPPDNGQTCRVALVLLKYISSHIKPIESLTDKAYESFRQGNHLESLQKFNSLMIMGDFVGLQNSIFILENLRDRICSSIINPKFNNRDVWYDPLKEIIRFLYNSLMDYFERQDVRNFHKSKIEISKLFQSEEQCNEFFDEEIISRWILSLKEGDYFTFKEIYNRITEKRYGFQLFFKKSILPKLIHASFLSGDIDSITHNIWDIYHGNNNFQKNSSLARILFSLLPNIEKKNSKFFHQVFYVVNSSKLMTFNESTAEIANNDIYFASTLELIAQTSIYLTHFFDALRYIHAPLITSDFWVDLFSNGILHVGLVVLSIFIFSY